MAARWVAFAILLAMLAIVGIFLWAVIRPPPPVSSGTEGAAGSPVVAEKHFAGPGAGHGLRQGRAGTSAGIAGVADRRVAHA